MSDTMPVSAAAMPATPETTTTTPAADFQTAGESLQGKSWADITAGLTPAAEPAAPVAESQPVDEATAAAAPSFTQDEAGQWHRPDGTYANADEIAALNALPADDAPPSAETPAESVPEPIVVKLRARDGSDAEIEVTDEKVAELLRANHNDGMRRDEFVRRMESVESKEAELREFETLMRTNPESVILQKLPVDKQVSIAVQLVAQHWDAIAERLVAFDQNPTERVTTAMNSQIAIRDQDAAFRSAVESSRYAAQVTSAVTSLVPETMDEQTAHRFMADAGHDLAQAIRANGNQPVRVEQIREILAPRLALYGVAADSPTGTATPSVGAPPAPPARPIARPLARSTATAPVVPSVPVSGAETAKASATVRRTVQAQRIAAAVAGSGAGAATVKAPLVPQTATLEEATAILKRQPGWGTAA